MENGPIETKVIVSTLASTITSFIMGWLLLQTAVPQILNEPLSALILAGATGALTFVFGWVAKHTNRIDPAARRGNFPGTDTGTKA